MDQLLIGYISPWLVVGLFVTLFFIIASELPRLLKTTSKLPKIALLTLLFSVVIGAYIRFSWTPNLDRIYFDEDRYLSYAVSFARYNKATSLEAASPTNLVSGKIDQVARVTVPVVNGLVLKGFGMSKDNLHLTAKLFSTGQILLLFIAAYLLFESAAVASLSALMFSVLPINAFWAPSTALDSYFVFFSLLSFIGACWYAKKTDLKSASFLTVTTTLLLFVRFEAFLFLLVLVATILVIRKVGKMKLVQKRDIRYLLVILPFILFRGLISLSVLGQTWCCGEATPLEAFQAGYFIRNTLPNLGNLFNRPEFPFIITVLAAVSLLGKKDLRIIPLGLWLFFYFFIYSFYFAGLFYAYSFSGSYGRYFLMLVPPLVILASVTIKSLWDLSIKSGRSAKILMGIVFLIAIATLYPTVKTYKGMVFLSSYDYIVDAPARRTQDFLRFTILPQIPKESIVIHPLTDIVLLEGQTGVYFGTFLTQKDVIKYVIGKMKDGSPTFMIQTYTCKVNPEKCEKITPYFDLVDYPLKEATPSGMTLLQLKLKKAAK